MSMNVASAHFCRQPPTARAFIKRTSFMQNESQAIEKDDFLMHYGISGQKWGVRRYQYEDGSLTDAGKARYNDNRPESERWEKSEAKQLSDDELNRRNNRLQREQTYRNLTTTDRERSQKTFKDDFKKKALNALLIIPVTAVLAVLGKKYAGKGMEKMVSLTEKYGKMAVQKLRTGNLLKQASVRGRSKYMKSFTEGAREYFPRGNGGSHQFNLVRKASPLWRKVAREWPAV